MKQYLFLEEYCESCRGYGNIITANAALLTGSMSKEDYALLAEEYYSSYGHIIEGTKFYRIFSDNIPDCCLFYVDEPGPEEEKEYKFHEIMEETYDKLKHVLE